ncbi:MAG TPA: SPOR domain-containing protein, partial [Bryobacteraceae bacterium]
PDAGTGATQPVSTVPVASESAPAETAPVRPAPEPERTKAVAPPPPERPKPVAPPVKQAEPPQSESAEPAAGQTFLQVAAVKKAQAQLMVEVLKGKGFHALMAQVEGKDVYRTLVGPVKDAGDLARTKAALESAGLKPFVKKY